MERSNPAGRGFAAAGLGALVVLGGGLAAAAAAGESATPTGGPPDEEVARGPQAVAGPDGVVGWITEADWERALQEGPPERTYGTEQVRLQSLEVYDEGATLVGYYTMGPLGFLPLALAQDPAAMDPLLDGLPAALTQPEARDLHEMLRSSAP